MIILGRVSTEIIGFSAHTYIIYKKNHMESKVQKMLNFDKSES